ncbi:helix-turn-helix transcriptional regulator [Streptomyces brevispora]|uniref:Helix-turn-helix domain-containing protein n=1 Tax=Streptomyces brevispora TaxID=887462 RepID=A0ABZ1G3C0_9ACTN|nr:helix-turn-helix transcriptional regulator [Streptomyces brevispora]WSC14377.1 helix-turn-helix domain-containing protein [Streptomyces brevispora]
MYDQPLPRDLVIARRRAVGDRIRAVRLHANLTQEAVSLRSGVSLASYNRIEQGHSSPMLDTLIRIADAIGVDLAALVRT